ncbi:hypothetical protein T439DRAFT_379628 [Meredithblackwellia eburnea MCA 4105]
MGGAVVSRQTQATTTTVSTASRKVPEQIPGGSQDQRGIKRVLSKDEMKSARDVKAKVETASGTIKAVAPVAPAKFELQPRSDRFWLSHIHIFLPLLPPKNYLSKLADTHPAGTDFKNLKIFPYKLLPQPKSIQGSMKSYQLEGFSFLTSMWKNESGCILADEMGLGKTIQTLALVAQMSEEGRDNCPHLILCPLSVLQSWINEIKRWLPSSFTATMLHSPSFEERVRLKSSAYQSKIVVTSYEMFHIEESWFKSKRWSLFVLDEGHKIKNWQSQISKSIGAVSKVRMKIILSGTPLQNNLLELWSLLHFLFPLIFTLATVERFKNAWNAGKGISDQMFLEASRRLLSLIMLRRTKAYVASEFNVPPREEYSLFVPLAPTQKFWYRRLLERVDAGSYDQVFGSAGVDVDAELNANVRHAMDSGKCDWKRINSLLIQLREVCDHPYILPDSEQEPFEVAEHIVQASGKLQLLDKMLAHLRETSPKAQVLIFSGFTRILDILEDFMTLRGIKYGRLDGGTARPRRTLEMKLFQQGKTDVFLISTRAGGLGVTLTAASHVVLFDQDWNPQVDLQAIARSHRIGQSKIVQVYRFITEGTVEQQMLNLLQKKLYLSAKLIGNNENSHMVGAVEENEETKTRKVKPSRDEVYSLLRYGSAAIAGSSAEFGESEDFAKFRLAPFSDIVQAAKERSLKQEALFKAEAGENLSTEEMSVAETARLEDHERLLLSARGVVETRKFQGKNIERTNEEIRMELDAEIKRRRGERTVMIEGHEVLKETISCRRWEAVPTITGSSSVTLKKTKPKAKFDHQDFCIACLDGGDVLQCNSCPRTLHEGCITAFESRNNNKTIFHCLQHLCIRCGRNATDAGGMLFRCQTCECAYCECCLPDSELEGVGDTLRQFLVLGYGKTAQAYYIRCTVCIESFATDKSFKNWWDIELAEVEKRWEKLE